MGISNIHFRQKTSYVLVSIKKGKSNQKESINYAMRH